MPITTNPQATDPQNNPSHSQLHRDEIEMLNTLEELDSEKLEIASKSTGAEIDTGTDDDKYVTSKAIADSSIFLNKIHQIYTTGDSLTGGYISSLLTSLGNKWAIKDKSVSGATTTQILARYVGDIVKNLDCEYVIIEAGINDIRTDVANATIQSNLQSMYTQAHNAGFKVVAVNISPFKGHTDWTSGRQTNLDAMNTWIASTATNIDYKIDIYSLLEDPGVADTLLATYDSGDHLHLSTAGYTVVANAIYSGTTWTKGSAGILNKEALKGLLLPNGTLINGKINVFISGGDVTISIISLDGKSPSATNPIYFVQYDNDTGQTFVREITSTLSVILTHGTNYFDLGNPQTADQENDLYVYLGYNNADNVVLGVNRFPKARRYNEFSTTAIDYNYMAVSDRTNADTWDQYDNIGRFNIKLSATTFNFSPSSTETIIINRPCREIRDSLWYEVSTFTNSWVNFGSGYPTAGFMKDIDGFVHIKGLVKSGTNGQSVFTLPLGYRPKDNTRFLLGNSNGSLGTINITTDGLVQITGTNSSTWFDFGDLSFYIGWN